MDSSGLAAIIREEAAKAGFDKCGITAAVVLEAERERLKEWIARDCHAAMSFMSRNIDKRTDPSLFWEEAVSLVLVVLNYFPGETGYRPGRPRIARYARGNDYHRVMGARLEAMLEALRMRVSGLEGRVFVDSSAMMEKALAVRAGLGVQGRNSLLIVEDEGSFFLLGGLAINMAADCDEASRYDPCGTCTRCIDACPTAALSPEGFLNAGRCISYLSIEHKGQLPHDAPPSPRDWIFGCDICQEVCPHNNGHRLHSTAEFLISEDRSKFLEDVPCALTPELFNRLFTGTAVERRGYEGLMRNIRFAFPECAGR